MMHPLVWIVFLPLLGALLPPVLAVFAPEGRGHPLRALLPALMTGLSFLLVCCFVPALCVPDTVTLGVWCVLPGGGDVPWSFSSGPVILGMLGLVTCVSAAVHVYALEYMKEDPRRVTFMALLSLFTFFMLLLVTSGGFGSFFLGWEGVGLVSWLLVGFWFHKPSASRAAFKAFLVNRVADAGLITGIALVVRHTDSLSFDALFAAAAGSGSWSPEEKTLVALCFLWGVAGKSAQWGLHVWLPDAMEGPTPVSALIHAATMVTAGVFMIVRLGPFFAHVPAVQDGMVILGGITAVLGGLVAFGQRDIKRLVAWSTCSHLGLMVLACGTGCVSAALMHLLAHGIAKAMVFLAAGCIIHAFHGQQDLHRMGGCARQMPVICGLMVLGLAHLAGLPGLAGHASKEAILEALWAGSWTWVSLTGFVCFLGAVLATGLYSKRLLLCVFDHPPAGVPGGPFRPKNLHKPSGYLWGPVAFLGAISLGLPQGLARLAGPDMPHPGGLPWYVAHAPLGLALTGAALAFGLHRAPWAALHRVQDRYRKGAIHGLGMDALWNRLLVKPFCKISQALKRADGFLHRYGPEGLARLACAGHTILVRRHGGGVNRIVLSVATGLGMLVLAGVMAG